jgi:hypothetical protein
MFLQIWEHLIISGAETQRPSSDINIYGLAGCWRLWKNADYILNNKWLKKDKAYYLHLQKPYLLTSWEANWFCS